MSEKTRTQNVYLLNELPIVISTQCMREKSDLHIHGHFQIIYVLSGTLKHTINDKVYIQHPGSCTTILPYTPHITDLTESEDTPVVIFISFYEPFLRDHGYSFYPYGTDSAHFEGKSIPAFFEFSGKKRFDADTLIRTMLSEFSKHKKMSFSLIASQTAELLHLLCTDTAGDESRQLLDEYVSGITRAVKYLNAHFDKKLTIDKLSSIAAMSRCMFTRSFKTITGMTFSNYLLSLRLQKAGNLLMTTNMCLNEIAKKTGLNDKSHLSHMFVQHYGVTPMKYKSMTSPLQKESHEAYLKRWEWINTP